MQGDLCTQQIYKAKVAVLWLRQPCYPLIRAQALGPGPVSAAIRFSYDRIWLKPLVCPRYPLAEANGNEYVGFIAIPFMGRIANR